jgi:hypothetical protein
MALAFSLWTPRRRSICATTTKMTEKIRIVDPSAKVDGSRWGNLNWL